MSIKFDPYAFGFFVVMQLFIVPWLMRHARKTRPKLPSSIRTAAYILLAGGGFFILVGVACGILFADLPRFWRFVWITIATVGGTLWIWNTFRLRDGIRSARWTAIPCLAALFLCAPFIGWVAAPGAAYCLFGAKRAREFFGGKKPPGFGTWEVGKPVPVAPVPTHHLEAAKDLPPSDKTHSLTKD